MSIMEKFSEAEQLEILEIARFALSDGEIFDYVADMLDLDDKYMQTLRDKVHKVTEGDEGDEDDEVKLGDGIDEIDEDEMTEDEDEEDGEDVFNDLD